MIVKIKELKIYLMNVFCLLVMSIIFILILEYNKVESKAENRLTYM